jgi:hypothetical protein
MPHGWQSPAAWAEPRNEWIRASHPHWGNARVGRRNAADEQNRLVPYD